MLHRRILLSLIEINNDNDGCLDYVCSDDGCGYDCEYDCPENMCPDDCYSDGCDDYSDCPMDGVCPDEELCPLHCEFE